MQALEEQQRKGIHEHHQQVKNQPTREVLLQNYLLCVCECEHSWENPNLKERIKRTSTEIARKFRGDLPRQGLISAGTESDVGDVTFNFERLHRIPT